MLLESVPNLEAFLREYETPASPAFVVQMWQSPFGEISLAILATDDRRTAVMPGPNLLPFDLMDRWKAIEGKLRNFLDSCVLSMTQESERLRDSVSRVPFPDVPGTGLRAFPPR